MHSNLASNFMMDAIQEWGQPEAARVASVQAVIDAIGLNAKAQGWPVFGGIWSKRCTGPDADKADQFLKNLTDTMVRGDFDKECQHVDQMVAAYKKTLNEKREAG